jgi:hypothetical protein
VRVHEPKRLTLMVLFTRTNGFTVNGIDKITQKKHMTGYDIRVPISRMNPDGAGAKR